MPRRGRPTQRHRKSAARRTYRADRQLKAVLVAWVIAGHAFLAYAAFGGWPYDEVAETTLPGEVELVLSIILGPSALFVIGTFFFLSGLMAPDSINRHGPFGFIWQRILRLGVPWLLFTLLVWPFVMWVAYRSAGHQLPIWQALQARQPFLDSGPLSVRSNLALCFSASRPHHLERPAPGRTCARYDPDAGSRRSRTSSFIVRMWYPHAANKFSIFTYGSGRNASAFTSSAP